MSPRTVTVVGGGIAGLTLAASLDPARWRVTVVEAQPERAGGGAALGLWPASRRILRSLGVWDRVDPGGGGAHGSLCTIDGRRLATAGGIDLTLVERPALLAALEAAVPDTVERVTAQVTDPGALDGDLVVGADGVRSRVRGLVAPGAAERLATAYVALRGTAEDVPEEAYGEYWGPGLLFGIAPMAGGRAYWYSTHRSALGPEPLDVERTLAQARARFAAAAPAVRHVLATAGSGTLATRLWQTPPMTRYARGRYVVIGDAAHASLPNLGRGAGDAMLDAATLAGTLARGVPIGAWEARRLPFTQTARVVAAALMRASLADRGHGLRDALVGALPTPRVEPPERM